MFETILYLQIGKGVVTREEFIELWSGVSYFPSFCLVASCLLLFYAIATVVQLYHGGDMIYDMRRRKPKPTLLPIQRILNPPSPTPSYRRV